MDILDYLFNIDTFLKYSIILFNFVIIIILKVYNNF